MSPRNRRRKPEITKKAVLDAAERLFAEHGFAGTSMRDLAKASGISQPLIHHHFGSKQKLYRVVKEYAISRFQESPPAIPAPKMDNEPQVATTVRMLFDFLRKNESILRLGVWSRIERDKDLWPGEAEIMRAVTAMARHAQEAGVLRSGIDPMFLTIMALALTVFWWEHRAWYLRMFSADRDPGDLDDAYLEQMLDVFLHGVLHTSSPSNRGDEGG